MDERLHDHDLLVRYLDGELTDAEKASLEARLQTDAALQEQLTGLRAAIEAIRHLGTAEKVRTIHAEMMPQLKGSSRGKVVPFRKVVRYSMAVAASLLVLFVGVRLYLSAQLSPEKLYSDTFVDFNVSATRGGNAEASEIEKHYRQKAYETVIGDVRSLRLDAKDSLLVGLSYLHTQQTGKAIGFFQRLALSENDFQPDAEFYLSLSYVRNKDYDRALPLLQKIVSSPTHLYHDQVSAEMVEKVRKLADK